MNCERCNKPLIAKTETDLLVTLRKHTMDEVPEITKRLFNAYKYVYDCNCPYNLAMLDQFRNKVYYQSIKYNQEKVVG